MTGQGKQPGAFDGFARGICGTLAAKGVGGAIVHVLDEDQPAGKWVELGKADCPQLAKGDATAPAKLLVDVPSLSGKDEVAVAKLLGKPTAKDKSKYGQKRRYALPGGGNVEITFIGGKADWMEITPGKDAPVPFGPACGQAIGISAAPAFASAATVRWDGVNGIQSVEAFPAGAHVGYWYVKVKTR
ncbi:hypothetical protein FVW20_00645 [Desulfovibrio oxamicus]|uniref:Uncharacterized protein n=1 Tax=Nitratidesulfovibrio oxamicus TaxID=32016 RepID=A0ABS0IZK9_9BACT|nr:hypothetical protein [Nitratidesulfovibrio oxamicus]MBG3875571.1 hypothetical protein [Nitratidesulfovibrio oxamicus]